MTASTPPIPASALRVPLLLPTPRDTVLTARILAAAGIETVSCRSPGELAEVLRGEVGAVMIAEEWLSAGAHEVLSENLTRQPAWSDLPAMVVARGGTDSRVIGRLVDSLGNATLLDRPLRIAALTSAARAALRARARQYQIRAQWEALEQARAQLAEAARRKDEFLAMLGHELRNPLAPIRAALQLLTATPPSATPPHELLATMQRQVEHMVRLVEDLVDVSRLTRGAIELRRERIDLSEALRSAVELSMPLIERGGHDLRVLWPPTPMVLDADPVRLAQVFGNLLNNAAKYSPPGTRIEVVARRDRDECVVEFADQGIGIEPDVLPRIFELFTQGRAEPHRARDGLGVGLSLVRTLVSLHGGTVSASSPGPGRGSRFTVRLPLASRQTPATAQAAPQPLATPSPALRALVIDDNRDAANTLAMLLDWLKVEHRVAYSGGEGIECALQFRPHVVLLDIGMPGLDGYQVAERLRQRPETSEAVLVALSGWNQDEDLARFHHAGFHHHLAKPAHLRDLQALLARITP